MLVEGELAVLVLQVVDVDRPIGRLRGHELVQGVPGYTLNVVVVLSDLPYHLACSNQSAPSQPLSGDDHSPLCALYIRATLSMLPVRKKTASGDHARS